MHSKASIENLVKLLDSEEIAYVVAYDSLKEYKDLTPLNADQRNKLLSITDQYGCNLLHAASSVGDLDLVKKLLGIGFNLNSKSTQGNTSIIFAVIRGHEDIVRFLIEMGADVNVGNSQYYPLKDSDMRILAMLYKAGLQFIFYGSDISMMDRGIMAMIMIHDVLVAGHGDFSSVRGCVQYRHFLNAFTCLVEVANLGSIINKRFITLYMGAALNCDSLILEAISHGMQYDRKEVTPYFIDIRNANSIMKTKEEVSFYINNQVDEIVKVLNAEYRMNIRKPKDVSCSIT